MHNQAILVYGNTCTGKSTLGRQLERFAFARYISFGDIKREEIARGTPLGIGLQEAIRLGMPIDPMVGANLVKSHFRSGQIAVISGFPISDGELAALGEICDCQIGAVVYLRASTPVILERFFERGVCSICHFPGKVGQRCPEHDVELRMRPDCSKEELTKRSKLYSDRIAPFVEFLSSRHPLLKIDTDTGSPADILRVTLQFLEPLLKKASQDAKIS